MSHGHEPLDIVEPFLYAALAGDTVVAATVNTRIINTLAPSEVKSPYVVFQQATIRDRIAASGLRLWIDAVYDVKIVQETESWLPLLPVAKRFDVLFDRPNEVIQTPNGVVEIWRERLISYPEMVQGVQLRHLGAQYHVRAYAA